MRLTSNIEAIMLLRPGTLLTAALGLAALAGCTYTGADIGNPFYRKAQWFSFVEGSDLAAACTPGSAERFRLVYNGLWDQQVRIYEWDSAERGLKISVVNTANVADITLNDPLSPWRAQVATVALDAGAYDRLAAALTDSGAFGPPALGLELPSHSYYWTAATCHGGQYAFTAWAYPSAAYDGARFPAALAALDPGRETIVKPGPVPVDVIREYERNRGSVEEFTLKVGPHGLR
jgi:hypothetical protein